MHPGLTVEESMLTTLEIMWLFIRMLTKRVHQVTKSEQDHQACLYDRPRGSSTQSSAAESRLFCLIYQPSHATIILLRIITESNPERQSDNAVSKPPRFIKGYFRTDHAGMISWLRDDITKDSTQLFTRYCQLPQHQD